jgi:hypothetical protein
MSIVKGVKFDGIVNEGKAGSFIGFEDPDCNTILHTELMRWVARRVVDKHMLHPIKMGLQVPVEVKDEKGNKPLTGGKGKDRRRSSRGSSKGNATCTNWRTRETTASRRAGKRSCAAWRGTIGKTCCSNCSRRWTATISRTGSQTARLLHAGGGGHKILIIVQRFLDQRGELS